MLLVQVHVLSASRAGPKDLLEFCALLLGMNTVLIPRILSSLPETRCSFKSLSSTLPSLPGYPLYSLALC